MCEERTFRRSQICEFVNMMKVSAAPKEKTRKGRKGPSVAGQSGAWSENTNQMLLIQMFSTYVNMHGEHFLSSLLCLSLHPLHTHTQTHTHRHGGERAF